MRPHAQLILLSLLQIIATGDAYPNLRGELEARKERDDSFDYDRFLQFNDDDDDPRHGGSPQTHDATNGGGKGGDFTLFPSWGPTAAPSPNSTTSSAPTACEDTTDKVYIAEIEAYKFCSWAASAPRLRCSNSNLQEVCPRSCGNCSSSSSVEPTLESSVSPSSKPSIYTSNAPSTRPSPFQSLKLPSASSSLDPTMAPSPTRSALSSGLPSVQPTRNRSSSPTRIASASPTRMASASPTRMASASVFPSSPPSLDPCKGNNGKYGDTSDEKNLTIVAFTYGIEMDMVVMSEMSAILSDLTKGVEEEQLNLLVQSFSTACNDANEVTTRSLNIFVDGKLDHLQSVIIGSGHTGTKDVASAQKQTVPDEIVGIKSDPEDVPVANGEKCSVSNADANGTNTICRMIDGRVTIYPSDINASTNITQKVLESIKSNMNAQLLDGSHPAITRVVFMDTLAEAEPEPEPETTPPLWMLSLAGLGGSLALLAYLRRRQETKNEEKRLAVTRVDDWVDINSDISRSQTTVSTITAASVASINESESTGSNDIVLFAGIAKIASGIAEIASQKFKPNRSSTRTLDSSAEKKRAAILKYMNRSMKDLEAAYGTLENSFASSSKQSWQEELRRIVSEEEEEEFEALEDQLLHTEAELEEAARLKSERQEFHRFEAEQEAARIMAFEKARQRLEDEKECMRIKLEENSRLRKEEEEREVALERDPLRASDLEEKSQHIESDDAKQKVGEEEQLRTQVEQEADGLDANEEECLRVDAGENAALSKAKEEEQLCTQAEQEAAGLDSRFEDLRMQSEQRFARSDAEVKEHPRVDAQEKAAHPEAEEDEQLRIQAEQGGARLDSRFEDLRIQSEQRFARFHAGKVESKMAAHPEAEEDKQVRIQVEQGAARLGTEQEERIRVNAVEKGVWSKAGYEVHLCLIAEEEASAPVQVSDTFNTDPNNYRSSVIEDTANASINASKQKQFDTPTEERATSVNTEYQEHVTIEVGEGAASINTEEVEPLHDDADQEASVEGSDPPAPIAEEKAFSPPEAENNSASTSFFGNVFGGPKADDGAVEAKAEVSQKESSAAVEVDKKQADAAAQKDAANFKKINLDDEVEPHHVEDVPVFQILNDETKQNIHHDTEVDNDSQRLDVDASKGEHLDTIAGEGPTPVGMEEKKSSVNADGQEQAAIEADEGPPSINMEEGKNIENEAAAARSDDRVEEFTSVDVDAAADAVDGYSSDTIKVENKYNGHYKSDDVEEAANADVKVSEEECTAAEDRAILVNTEEQEQGAIEADGITSSIKTEEGKSVQDVVDHEDAVLVQIEKGMIESAKLKAEDGHLRIQAEQEGRQLNAEGNEAKHKDSATRLDNGGDGIYLRGESKVVEVEEEEEWMSAYDELCQHIEVQPEQARQIVAIRESDTVRSDHNNYRSVVIAATLNANMNASMEKEIDTLAEKRVDEGAPSINTEGVDPLHVKADEKASIRGSDAALAPVAEKKAPSPSEAENNCASTSFFGDTFGGPKADVQVEESASVTKGAGDDDIEPRDGAESAVSTSRVEESTSVKDDVNSAAEDDIELRDVTLGPESHTVDTDTELNERQDTVGVNINASVGGDSDKSREQKSAAIDADSVAPSVKRGEGKADAMFDARGEESASAKVDVADDAVDKVKPRREKESDTIKSETILERHHDTKVVLGAQSINVNKAEEQHIDTSAKEWLSLLHMEDQESTATDADELVSAFQTEEGMTAIVEGDEGVFEEESSIVKTTEVASSLTDEEVPVRIEAEEEEKAALLQLEAEEEERAARFQSLEEMRLGIAAQDSTRKLRVQNERRRTESEKRNSLFSGRRS